MLRVTVTTARDTRPHLERFVAGNLAGGIDHLIVVLDDPGAADQAESRAFLEAHDHVTCVAGDATWWAGDRPHQLNVRQRTNANVVRTVVAEAAPDLDVAWIFHLDADEIAQLDDAALAQVPADVDAVRLTTWETVAQASWDRDPDLFKTPLDADDLDLLHLLGAIDKPVNGAYFHGHVSGKAGARPEAPGWFTLHHLVDARREPRPEHADPRLRVLHYESYDGEEFVRKWLAMIGSGPTASFRAKRGDTAAALRTLVAKDLPRDVLAGHLRAVFERTTADDVALLSDLGLLRRLDPRQGTHRPRPLDPAGAAALAASLERYRSVPKRRFHSPAAAGAAPEPDPAPPASTSTSTPAASPDPEETPAPGLASRLRRPRRRQSGSA